MTLRLFIFGAIIGTLLSIPSTTHARSPERQPIAQPACTITGTPRNDVLRGTNGADVICGLAGNDIIFGLGGNDTIVAGDGNDTVDAGNGHDRVDGGSGNDRLSGSIGNDTLIGSNGNDVIEGGAGDDVLNGDRGNDQLNAGNGDDSLTGGSDRDRLQPGTGDNYCATDPADTTVGRCRADTTAPVFAPMALTRSVNAGETAVFEWVVEDESPIALSWMFIGGASGWISEWCGFPAIATEVGQVSSSSSPLTSTTFRVECPIPTNAVNGEYMLELHASDIFGNGEASQYNATPTRIILMVGNGAADADAPALSQVTVSAPESPRTAPLTVSWRVDDATGISGTGVWLALNGYSFADIRNGAYQAYNPSVGVVIPSDSGVAMQYTQEITWNAHAPAGTYTVWVSVRDTLGNRNFVQTNVTVTLR